MARKLPKVDRPLHELHLPISKKDVFFRQCSVKDEKILLLAQETEDIDKAVLATKQVLNNCLIDVDVSNLPLTDVEYALITIRSKSVNDKITFMVPDDETKEQITLTLDLNEVKVIIPEDHSNIIKTSEYQIIMKYPTLDDFVDMVKEPNNKDLEYSILLNCMEKLVGEDGEVYTFEEFTDEEVADFIDELPGEVLSELKRFFTTLPTTQFIIPYKRPSDGVERTFYMQGFRSFFV